MVGRLKKALLDEHEANILKQQHLKNELIAGKKEKRAATAAELWKTVKENSEKLKRGSMESYNTWAAAQVQSTGTLWDVAKALHASLTGTSVLEVVGGEVKLVVLETIEQVTGYYISNDTQFMIDNPLFAIKSAWRLKYPGTPLIKFNVKVDENGHINSEASSAFKGEEFKPLNDKIQLLFDEGLARWADMHGYRMEKEGEYNVFMAPPAGDAPARKMTREEFQHLSVDPERGLKAMLSADLEMPASPIPPPRPW